MPRAKAKSKLDPLAPSGYHRCPAVIAQRTKDKSFRYGSGPYRHFGLAGGNLYSDLSHFLVLTRSGGLQRLRLTVLKQLAS